MERRTTYMTKLTICGVENDAEFKEFAIGLLGPVKAYCEQNREQMTYSAIINDDKNIVEFTCNTHEESVSSGLNNCFLGLGVVLGMAKVSGHIKEAEVEVRSSFKF